MNILSKNEIIELYKNNKVNLCNILKCKYIDTYEYIDSLFGESDIQTNKFSEKIYKYVFPNEGYCKICKKKTFFRSFSDGYMRTCSRGCQQIDIASKYGVKNLFQSEYIKNKIKKTNLIKYGFESAMKNPEVLKKIKNTKKERYGNENYVNMDKVRKTMLSRYNVEHPSHFPDYERRWQKGCKKKKEYQLPSGQKIFLQGYEPQALNILLEKYKESDIDVSKTKNIFYKMDNKKHIFWPDFYLKSENKFIEVKSKFTYERWKLVNELKMKSCKEQNINIEFWILNKKGEIQEKIL
jgi:hypothetical protein